MKPTKYNTFGTNSTDQKHSQSNTPTANPIDISTHIDSETPPEPTPKSRKEKILDTIGSKTTWSVLEWITTTGKIPVSIFNATAGITFGVVSAVSSRLVNFSEGREARKLSKDLIKKINTIDPEWKDPSNEKDNAFIYHPSFTAIMEFAGAALIGLSSVKEGTLEEEDISEDYRPLAYYISGASLMKMAQLLNAHRHNTRNTHLQSEYDIAALRNSADLHTTKSRDLSYGSLADPRDRTTRATREEVEKQVITPAQNIYNNKTRPLEERAYAAIILSSHKKDLSGEKLKAIKREIKQRTKLGGERDSAVICEKLTKISPYLPTLYASILYYLGRASIKNPTDETMIYFNRAVELREQIDINARRKINDPLYCSDYYKSKDMDDTVLFKRGGQLFCFIKMKENSLEVAGTLQPEDEELIIQKIADLDKISYKGDKIHEDQCKIYKAKLTFLLANIPGKTKEDKIRSYDNITKVILGTNHIEIGLENITEEIRENQKIDSQDKLLNQVSRALEAKCQLLNQDMSKDIELNQALRQYKQVLELIESLDKQFLGQVEKFVLNDTKERRGGLNKESLGESKARSSQGVSPQLQPDSSARKTQSTSQTATHFVIRDEPPSPSPAQPTAQPSTTPNQKHR